MGKKSLSKLYIYKKVILSHDNVKAIFIELKYEQTWDRKPVVSNFVSPKRNERLREEREGEKKV